MASSALLGITSLKWVKARGSGLIHDGRTVDSCATKGGFLGSSHLIRLVMCNYGEDRFPNINGRDRRRASSDHAGHKQLQDGNMLPPLVAKLIDRVNQGISVSSYAYHDVLKLCAKEKDLESVKQVHDSVKDTQMEQHRFVGTMLIKCYIECCRLEIAQEMLNKFVNKDIVTWNMMISGCVEHVQAERAIQVYKQMSDEGVQPNAVTYLSVLKACASPTALPFGKVIHAHIRRDGYEADVRVNSALVRMYAKCGSIDDARAVFTKVGNRDVVSWNVMIGAFAEHGLGDEAFSLFRQMQSEGLKPDAITYLSILNPCSSTGATDWVREVHAHVTRAGTDVRVENALIQMYSKSGSIEDARAVFGKMGRRDVVSWNVMIGGLVEHGLGQEAFSLFLQMRIEGFTPNAITYLSILNPCLTLEWTKEIHTQAIEAGLDVDVQVGTALVRMYAKSGNIAAARAVFGKMGRRDIVSWTVMIGGLAEHGFGQEAFSMFLKMHSEGFTADAITYLSLLNPCSSMGAVEWVKEVHAYAIEAGMNGDVQVGNALVQMYAKSGLIVDAKRFFDQMRSRDVISWSVMLGGLAQHGQGREALKLFKKMKSEGVKPNDAVFVAVLSACSHAGLFEEGCLLFDSMRSDHDIEPALEHYNCMVDILGRAGRLKEAKLFIIDMSISPNIVTWKAFLGACRTYNNVELAEFAFKQCLKLDQMDPAPYVLLSNVYATGGSWDQVRVIRGMMQERGVRKEPGRCWIEVDNKVHDFLVGDRSHPETREIYSTLSSLSEKLKSEGYVADTRLVLRDIAEEDKVSAICSHSEKLAIAYGLMHVPPGKPIRVYENLRICTDCHEATKLITKVTGREVLARDANRFHHFKCGSCSCDDYW